MLLVRVRDLVAALPLASVVETMRMQPITPVGAVPKYVCGMALLRGKPTVVVDLGELLGMPVPARAARLVTLRLNQRLLALAVEEVIGVEQFGADSLQELPPLLRNAASAVVDALGSRDRELLVALDAARLLPDDLYEVLAAAGGAR